MQYFRYHIEGYLCFLTGIFSVLSQTQVQRLPPGSQGPDHLSAVRPHGLPEGGVLQVQLRGKHARGGETQHRLRGRHVPLPRCQLRHHCRDQGQESLHLGLNLSGRFRRGRQRIKV